MRLELSRLEEVVIASLDELRTALLSDSALDREAAATRLAAGDREAAGILAGAAADNARPLSVRVTALRHLALPDMAEPLLAKLLHDPDATIRIVAIQRAAALGLASLTPLVEACIGDRASIWDLDVQLVVGDEATAALRSLGSQPDRKAH